MPIPGSTDGQLRDLDQRHEDAEQHHLQHRPHLEMVYRPQHPADPARNRRPARGDLKHQHVQQIGARGDYCADCHQGRGELLVLAPHFQRAAGDRRARRAADDGQVHQRRRIGDDVRNRGRDREREAEALRTDRPLGEQAVAAHAAQLVSRLQWRKMLEEVAIGARHGRREESLVQRRAPVMGCM